VTEHNSCPVTQQRRGREGRVQFVPDGCDPYQRVYICTHGWSKNKSRCTGSRKRQHIRLTDCPFKFTVQWVQKNSGWQLQVKNGIFLHNHAVTAETYGAYPSSRGVDDPRIEARVDEMLAVGAKRSRIYDYLLEHNQNVIQLDVDNMVRQHALSVTSVDDNDATAAEIAAFMAADPRKNIERGRDSFGRDWRHLADKWPHAGSVQAF
jgi:hypothetical protein